MKFEHTVTKEDYLRSSRDISEKLPRYVRIRNSTCMHPSVQNRKLKTILNSIWDQVNIKRAYIEQNPSKRYMPKKYNHFLLSKI